MNPPPSEPADDNPYEPPSDAGEESVGAASDPVNDSQDNASGQPGKRQAGMLFIWITLFIDILGIAIVIPVLPGLVRELTGLGPSKASVWYGIIAASYAGMQFLFAPVVGGLSDRFGRRPILLASLFGLGVDFIIQGFANSVWLLFVARMIGGIFGASFTSGNAYIADISTDETRARNFGLVGAAFGLGFIIGPAVGGVLSDTISLRAPFFLAAGLALVNWLYGFFILPESLPPEKRRKFSIKNFGPLAAFKTLRRYPFVAGLAIAFLLKALAQRGMENVFVLFSEFKFEWGGTEVGFFLCWVGVTAVIVQGGMVRPTVKRFGERPVLLFATIISAISFLGYAFADNAWMFPLIAMVGALGGLAGPTIQSMVTKTVDESEQGEVQGALVSMQSLTSVFAPIIFTSGLFRFFTNSERVAIIGDANGDPIIFPGAPFLLGAILIALAFFVTLIVFKKHPESDS